MALPYFFEAALVPAKQLALSEETSKHCVQVLRMKAGAALQLTDGKGHLVTAIISEANKKQCIVNIEETQFVQPAKKRVCIAISLLKNTTRFEWFLEKATEMGVAEIIPLLCARTEKQHFRFDRMNNILIAAMLQSQQAWLPHLHQPQDFKEALHIGQYEQRLIAHCEEHQKNAILQLPAKDNVALFIGPEGDFTPSEIEVSLTEGFVAVTLGATRLRTETAGVVASALLVNR